MNFLELLQKNRSYRRFFENEPINLPLLETLIEKTRYTPSSRNLQPLKYLPINTPEQCSLVYPYITLGGYFKQPVYMKEGERPPAFIIILNDNRISSPVHYDAGIAAHTILLAASELGLGGCIIASVNREFIKNNFNLPNHLEILLVIAIGKPNEKIVIDELPSNGDIKYWNDEHAIHHVPKRKLNELIVYPPIK